MANIFSSIPRPKLKRNTFNLSHEVKLTTEIGRLTPILCEPVVPGDSWKVKTEMLIRVAPLLAPVMHRVNIYTHFFFVPMRLIWKDWERFITGGESGTEEPAYPKLLLNSGNLAANSKYVEKSSLLDYLDFPTCDFEDTSRSFVGDGDTMIIDALPFRAYQLIYNEYYRDQNLEQPINITRDVNGLLTDGETIRNLLTVRYRKWEKDYFTSALPWTQRGAETTIGLSGNAPVQPSGDGLQVRFRGVDDGSLSEPNLSVRPEEELSSNDRYNVVEDDTEHQINWTNLHADLSKVNATTINELRRAINLQAYKEVLARSGSRYIEVIRGLFGVVSSDARLQRPEFLGGGKTPLMFGEVLQTSETTENSMLANFAGRAAAAGTTHKFKKFFEEHGLIIGIMSVMPKPAYMQGLPRKWYKFDRLDHYIPQFANIGEQPILAQELKYMFGNDSDPMGSYQENHLTFGYTPRYAEYKYIPSRVHGLFKTNLRFWHMARKFGEPSSDAPNLNKNFVTCFPSEVDRVFAVYSDAENPWTEHLWCQLYHNIKATRPMPKFGVPLI